VVSAHPAAAQRAQDPITFQWGAVSAAVLADSTLGLLVAAVPPGSRLVRFTGRFAPGPAASWARQADTLLGHLPAPEIQFLPLLGEDGSVLALGADSASGPDLVFRPARSPAYSVGLSLDDLRRFLAAVVTAALASDMSPETPPTSHDSLGTVYWSFGEDSALVAARTVGQPPVPRVPAGLKSPGTRPSHGSATSLTTRDALNQGRLRFSGRPTASGAWPWARPSGIPGFDLADLATLPSEQALPNSSPWTQSEMVPPPPGPPRAARCNHLPG